MRKGKRRSGVVKLDNAVNGDVSVDTKMDEGKRLLKVDKTTWILVSEEKLAMKGAEKCIQEFQDNLNFARSKVMSSY